MYEGAALLTQTSGDDFLKGRAATDAQIEQAAKPEAQQAEPASAQVRATRTIRTHKHTHTSATQSADILLPLRNRLRQGWASSTTRRR
jgi:hypothetical protein